MRDIWKRKQEMAVLDYQTANGVPYLAFPALERTGIVCHGFSTRMGGVSTGVYSTMNFAFLKGDDPDHVRENYRRMAKAIGVDEEKMVLSWQTHTTNIRKVTEDDAGKGITRERDYHDIDGLITDVPGLTLVTFYADCVPLYFLDPVRRAVGLSHSGWRGTVGRMGQATVEAMRPGVRFESGGYHRLHRSQYLSGLLRGGRGSGCGISPGIFGKILAGTAVCEARGKVPAEPVACK